MTPELNWCGLPIGPGESYVGKPEHISKPWGQKPAAKQHYCVVTESHLAEVFGNGSRKLKRPEAAKLLELLTDCHRTTCYRALRLNGRFARNLYSDGTMLSWRSL
jgi:aminoglycoside phosphotransferase family enzyme